MKTGGKKAALSINISRVKEQWLVAVYSIWTQNSDWYLSAQVLLHFIKSAKALILEH